MPWWSWLVVAWLAADCVFVIAWTRRVPLRDPDDLDVPGGLARHGDRDGDEAAAAALAARPASPQPRAQ